MKKIMFNDSFGLTQAVLDGRKTMTRRIAYDFREHTIYKVGKCVLYSNNHLTYKAGEVQILDELRSPQYQVGEIVAIAQAYNDFYNDECDPRMFPDGAGWTNKMFVRADLMPHQIRITNVRVERLVDISYDDILAEGISTFIDALTNIQYFTFENAPKDYISHRTAFRNLIDKVSGKGTWESNPYVFAYEFELVK